MLFVLGGLLSYCLGDISCGPEKENNSIKALDADLPITFGI